MRKYSYSFSSLLFIITVFIYLVGQGGSSSSSSSVRVAAQTDVYIVYMGERQHEDPQVVTDSHYDMLITLMNSKELALESMVYSYSHGFSGFAAKLTDFQAQQLSEREEVVAVRRDSLYEVQTTRSWEYLQGLSPPHIPNIHRTNMGDGIIIGVLDTGIWPESKSFNDEGLGEIPSGWKGSCKSGEEFNPSKHCNKKIIGANWYVDGLIASFGIPLNLSTFGEILSARDAQGHGTHVSSTAAGAYVPNVSYDGVGVGTARGGAPRSRLAIYKVCWAVQNGACAGADILKGFDDAIKDGVHVLTLSIAASSLPLYSEVDGRDSIAIGSFHAVRRGITVVCGAGNNGPSPQTVKNIAPWIINVAASTMDRAFRTQITLGNNITFVADSIHTAGSTQSKFSGLFYPGETSSSRGACEVVSFVDRSLIGGKVVLCFSTASTPSVTTSVAQIVKAARGAGVIVAKQPNLIAARCGRIPCAEVDYEIGTKILFYIRSTKTPMARLSPPTTVVGETVSANIAEFSSRGPNSVAASILKIGELMNFWDVKQPDIAAPGVQVIAATSPLDPSSQQGFTMLSGTSMATPHIAGIVALLSSLNPDWSPAAIRSALTTTAWTTNSNGLPIFAEGTPLKPADAFDFGGGIANPNAASCPGLIYDMEMADYIYYLCAMDYSISDISKLIGRPVSCPNKTISILDVNLPSITVPHLRNSVTLTRTVTNVGATNSIYSPIIEHPVGTFVFVTPPLLIFTSKTKKISFKVTITSMHQHSGGYNFGSIIWTDGVHYVRSPIAVGSATPELRVASM